MSTKKKFLLTSALPYANGGIHLGHLAGAYLTGDIFARYCRLKKRDVVYICGSDEHGVPIMLKAREAGVDPQKIVDQNHELIKDSFDKFGIQFDYYGRTTSPKHYQTSQEFFRTLAEKDVFVLKTNEQLYDPEAQMFLADRFVRGTCPVCGYEEAYGDQCEKCGSSLSPQDLINPRSAITDAKPILKETTHWYLPLERFQPALEEWIGGHPEWRNNVLGQINSWFKAGLKDRAVTRDLPWGIPVPENLPGAEGVDVSGKVLYVWFDAPIGYISATREWAELKGQPDLWKNYWQDADTNLIHFIGKDNIVFHCLIFPTMLQNHGDYVLPENVPANEFLNLEGNKLSTSRDYAVWLHDYLEKFDPDPLRYTLTINMPETKDADFSWKEFQARHNNELADILGNFINRTFTFINRYFDGKIPARGKLDVLDNELIRQINQARKKTGAALDRFQYKAALKRAMDLARFANKYFNDKEPWQTRKNDLEGCANTLHFCAQAAAAMAVILYPFLPFSSSKIWQMLALAGQPEDCPWDDINDQLVPEGHAIGDLEILFRKIEDKDIQPEIDKLQEKRAQMAAEAAEKAAAEAPANLITFDDFQNVSLKAARVLEVEAIPKTKKLLKIQVDLGSEKRQIVSGLAEFYTPEDLVGKTVVVVTNLQPAKIRGVESLGMLLAAEHDGKLVVVTIDGEVDPGSPVG